MVSWRVAGPALSRMEVFTSTFRAAGVAMGDGGPGSQQNRRQSLYLVRGEKWSTNDQGPTLWRRGEGRRLGGQPPLWVENQEPNSKGRPRGPKGRNGDGAFADDSGSERRVLESTSLCGGLGRGREAPCHVLTTPRAPRVGESEEWWGPCSGLTGHHTAVTASPGHADTRGEGADPPRARSAQDSASAPSVLSLCHCFPPPPGVFSINCLSPGSLSGDSSADLPVFLSAPAWRAPRARRAPSRGPILEGSPNACPQMGTRVMALLPGTRSVIKTPGTGAGRIRERRLPPCPCSIGLYNYSSSEVS